MRVTSSHQSAGENRLPGKKMKLKEAEDIVDSFDSWLERQTPKPALAKHGYIADAKIEDSSK